LSNSEKSKIVINGFQQTKLNILLISNSLIINNNFILLCNNHKTKTMTKKALILIIFLTLLNILSFGQVNKDEFKPTGKPFVKIFTNFHSMYQDNTNYNAFEVQRAYFGYGFKLSENISGKLNLDIANPASGKLDMTAFLKNAYFQYKKNNFTVSFGLITLQQFKFSEKQWGGRYIYKSFQDQSKMGYSADLAFYTSYKFNDIATADISISNGEGYKSIESDSIFKYSAGLTLKPAKGLTFRAYYDYMGKNDVQQSLSLFLGYNIKNFKFGTEYAKQLNHKMVADNTFAGFSVFGSYSVDKMRFFGRYDNLNSEIIGEATEAWNFGKDGEAFIVGIEFNVTKGLKIAPNYQGWKPADGSPIMNIAYISCEIKI